MGSIGADVSCFENGAQMMPDASRTLNLPYEGRTVICGTLADCNVSKKGIHTEQDGFLYDHAVRIEKRKLLQGRDSPFRRLHLCGDGNTRHPVGEAITMQKNLDAIDESAATGREILPDGESRCV